MRQETLTTALKLRARGLQAMRAFFEAADYLEVETPIRIPAPAPEAHIDPEPCGRAFLQTSPELCMKRLLAAGYPRLYQICRCFRQGERGRRHLPEFTLLEWYTAHQDYRHMMDQTEALVKHVAQSLGANSQLKFQDRIIDLQGPFERLRVDDAFRMFAGGTPEAALSDGRFDEIVGCTIEPRLGWERPVLNDPEEQRRRFNAELDTRQKAGRPVTPLPERFLEALDQMPPATGNALGVDRLVMLFADTLTIDDVTAFVPEEL